MNDFTIPPDAVERQRRAADPAVSAWVSANAGCGKTKVLADRVLRLLLAGCPPGRILCLTFTKAAAANMANRIFEILARWVTLDDAALAAALAGLDGAAADPARLAAARRLFARAVETPGGLKIETIHAFCERLLHIAPFEANVPGRFSVLDDQQSAEIVARARAEVLAAACAGDAALADAFEIVGAHATGDRLEAILAEALALRDLLADEAARRAALARLAEALDVEEDVDEAALDAAVLAGGFPEAERLALVAALEASGAKTDAEQAARLRRAGAAASEAERREAYLEAFFSKSGPRAERGLCGKAAGRGALDRLLAEQARLVALADRRRAAGCLSRTRALLELAAAIHARVEREKRRAGALDFDDLVRATLALLRRGEGAWLLYKLDRGVDHVLVDEAQDTNPDQWEILRRLTAEFHAGEGAAGRRARTVFAVGDPKQSIYSFQGADPRAFEESRAEWARSAAGVGARFEEVGLVLSFRTAPRVLKAVDAVFSIREHLAGLAPGDPVPTVHESARAAAPGLVELWPTIRPGPKSDPEAWTHPVDFLEESAPAALAARRVARAIHAWTTLGDATGRVRRPGDVLVLVRKRGPAFRATIKALKDAGVPVAGADRLVLSEHIAIEDLVAAGRAALLPDDDLALACALKSPLVGLDDDDLARVAARRGEASLAQALAAAADAGDAAAARGRAALDAWRGLARGAGPFGFYAALLGPLGGRRALVARLGAEAADAVDAFLCLARDAEGPLAPSLGRFLAGFEGAAREIKRDLESGADEVRVMTVHGAKGLEAPVVVVLDDVGARGGRASGLVLTPVRAGGEALPVWSPGKEHDCGPVGAARAAAEERAAQEANRLLYVALTRAKDHLVVAPFFNKAEGEEPPASWGAMVRRALAGTATGEDGPVEVELPYGPALVWRDAVAAAPQAAADRPPERPAAPEEPEPAWLREPAPREVDAPAPLAPASALAAADRRPRPAQAPALAQARLAGALVHALVERLPAFPESGRAAAARAFVDARAPGLPPERRARIAADALATIGDPRLAPLFARGALAEAPVAGRVRLPDGSEVAVAGQIDRLAIEPDRVVLAEFKTGARPPAPGAPLPDRALAQVALYAALMERAFPDRPVRALLVWTAGSVVREATPEEIARGLAAVAAREAAP